MKNKTASNYIWVKSTNGINGNGGWRWQWLCEGIVYSMVGGSCLHGWLADWLEVCLISDSGTFWAAVTTATCGAGAFVVIFKIILFRVVVVVFADHFLPCPGNGSFNWYCWYSMWCAHDVNVNVALEVVAQLWVLLNVIIAANVRVAIANISRHFK